MAKSADNWSLEEAYPPMLAVDYRAALRKVVAEWLRAAGATCDEDYKLTAITEVIESFVVGDLKQSLPGHGSFPCLRVGALISRSEDD